MKILAISGSLRSSSVNTSLLRAAAGLAPLNVNFTIYEGLADLPHFNPELDNEIPPISVTNLRQQLGTSDGVIICTPEYAYGMPGVLKNALDWIVSSGELVGKPVVTISASPSDLGGSQAHASLRLTLTALAANMVEGGELTVGFVTKKINGLGEIKDSQLLQALTSTIEMLVQNIQSQLPR
ncbi:NADPH-dependent FMN reductase (plasmid) [Nostoc sp. HK-01]|nr:NADPH-dependent FMN reductase [Nostoc sp. HK-01]